MVNLTSLKGSMLKLRSDRRGFLQNILMVGVAIMMIIVVALALTFFLNAMPNIADPVANETVTNTINIGWQSLGILAIAVLIGAVTTIIVVLMGAFGGRGR